MTRFQPLPIMESKRGLEFLASLDSDLLSRIHDELQVQRGPNGEIQFMMPEEWIHGHSREFRLLLQQLANLTRRRVSLPKPINCRWKDLLGLKAGIPWMLLHSGRSGSAARPEEGQYLLVAIGLDQETALSFYDQLNWHPTHVRFAEAVTREDKPVCLFHARDDETRITSFQPLVTSGLLEQATLLAPFATGVGLVFLPEAMAPDVEALHYFGTLIRNDPSLLDTPKVTEESNGLLYALMASRSNSEAGTTQIDAFPLSGLRLWNKTAAWKHIPATTEIHIHSLRNTQALIKALPRYLRKQQRQLGYHLELHRLRRSASPTLELERIQGKIRALEHRRDYLRSFRRPRWRLLRFTQDQLEPFIDVLSRFPIAEIESKKILYGYEAHIEPTRPEARVGDHYLLFDDEALLADPFVDALWRRDGETRMGFWLDPYWSHFYYDSLGPGGHDESSLLFVPEGHALFPSLHSHNRVDMDEYLREMVENDWFSGSVKLPRKPLYLFEEHPDPAKDVKLRVLDLDGFAPLHKRIHWINNNLELVRAVGVDNLIEKVADQAAVNRLMRELVEDAETVAGRFDDAARQAEQAVAGELAALLRTLSREIAEVADKVETDTRKIDNYHDQRRLLEIVLRSAKQGATEIDQLITKNEQLADWFNTTGKTIDVKIRTAVREAENVTRHASARVADIIDKFKRAARDLRNRRRRARLD